jgi:ABC-type phosphate/phosphonate transport system substrate-binding protein
VTRPLARVLLLLALLVPCHAAAAEAPLRLGVVPFFAPEKIWALYTPFIEFLRERTGLPWELKVYPDHDALVGAVCRGEVSVSLLGPAPAARVMERCRVRPLAVALSEEGLPTYTAVIVTTDPAVASLKDLRGKPFGYFKGSTAAHLIPMKMLDEARVPLSEIPLVSFSGQDRIVDALLRRDISGAGIKESLYRKAAAPEFRKVAESGELPNFAFYSSPSLTQAVERKFVSALLSLSPRSNESDRALAAPWDDEVKHGFVLPPKGFLESVTELGKVFRKYGR